MDPYDFVTIYMIIVSDEIICDNLENGRDFSRTPL